MSASNGKLCVAYLVHHFGMGGSERCIARIVNRLDRSRFRPLVVSLTTTGPAARWIEADDVEIVEVGKRNGNDVRAVWRLAQLLRDRRVDILHSHNWGTLVEAVLAKRCAGVRHHIHSERGTVLGDLNLHGTRRWLRARCTRWGLSSADAVVSVAECTRARLSEACGFPSPRIRVIPNGVEAPAIADFATSRSQLREQLGLAPDTLLLGSVGRLVDVKNFAGLLDAVGATGLDGRRLALVLVGDGPDRRALDDQIADLDLTGRVHLVGDQDQVGPWLAAMDAYVNCSRSEGISQGVLEALSVGLPLIVTDVGDHARVVQSEQPCGLVVPAGDTAALTSAIHRIVDDQPLRDRLRGNSAARQQAAYNLPDMVRAYADLYNSLITC